MPIYAPHVHYRKNMRGEDVLDLELQNAASAAVAAHDVIANESRHGELSLVLENGAQLKVYPSRFVYLKPENGPEDQAWLFRKGESKPLPVDLREAQRLQRGDILVGGVSGIPQELFQPHFFDRVVSIEKFGTPDSMSKAARTAFPLEARFGFSGWVVAL